MPLPPVHPPLVALVYVVHNVVVLGIHPLAAARSVVVALVLALLVQVVTTLALRDRHRGAVAASAVVLLVVLWGPLSSVVAASLRLAAWQLALLGGLVIGAGVVVARVLSRGPLRLQAQPVSRAMSAFAVALGAIVVLELLTSPLLGQLPRDFGEGPETAAGVAAAGPDIYILIADGHPRADALLEQTGKDISPFTAGLGDRGFTVADESHSNYTWTAASLTSVLQMRHLNDVEAGAVLLDAHRSRELIARIVLDGSPAFAALRERGYEIVGIRPPHEHATVRSVDRLIDPGYVNTFECHLLRETLLGSLAWAVAPGIVYDAQRAAVVRSLDELFDVAREDGGPRLAFAHLPVPHLPVMWDAQGNPVNDPNGSDCTPKEARGMSRDELQAAYNAQLDHLHGMLLDALDRLVAADRDAVIIVMSDHGASISSAPDGPYDQRAWRDQFATLFAARTPGQEDLFGDEVSLVNLFPRLFNAYFGAAVPVQPDTTFIAREGNFRPADPEATSGSWRARTDPDRSEG